MALWMILTIAAVPLIVAVGSALANPAQRVSKGWGLASTLFGFFVLVAIALLFVRRSAVLSSESQANANREASSMSRAALDAGENLNTSIASGDEDWDGRIDALWDRLTAPRIKLEDDTAKDPTAKPADDAAAGEDKGEAAAARPRWVDQQASFAEGLNQLVLKTPPYKTLRECYDALMEQLQLAVVERTTRLAAEWTGATSVVPSSLAAMNLSLESLVDAAVADQFVESIDTSVGEMQQAYLLVKFSPELDERLLEGWRRYARRERVAVVGVSAGAVVGSVALALGLLKLDTATRGYYTKRLFLGVPAAIIGALALLGLFS